MRSKAVDMIPGDQAKVSLLVHVAPMDAFRIFTEEIDGWWRSGMKYRLGKNRSVVHLEPKLGGRLFETFNAPSGAEKILETGVITTWDPPNRVVFEWRASNFKPDERTEVDVTFEPSRSGTNVTVVHRGWAKIRPDHPARHGEGMSEFTRSLASWWGDLMTSFRIAAEG
jgi:uncharacterized protein YndB with AHSA1/START domain